MTWTPISNSLTVRRGQDVLPRSSGHLAAPPKSHARLRAGHPMAGVHVASLVGPGLAPVVGVITPQLKNEYTT